MNNFDLFLERAKLCAKTILEMSHPTLITHYDCDGLCSGAIVCKFLEVNNIKYELKIVRKLDDEFLESLKNKQELIFSDLGGAAKKLNEFDSNIVIFDHHQTEGLNKLQLNPQLFGLDGGNEMSASSCVYWALEQLPEIALVGSIGDMQYPLKGANRTLAQKFEKMGILEIETDLKIYGRASRPLVQLLSYSDEPFFPGLANNEERCAWFLESIGLKPINDSWPKYIDLSLEQKKLLIGALASYLTEYYKEKIDPNYLIGEVYNLKRFRDIPELYDAGEFSTLLNACGRHKKEQLGINICLGDLKAIEEGKKVLAAHKKALRDGVDYAYKNVIDLGSFLFLDGRGVIDDGIIGVVAGMLYAGARKKVILAIALDENNNIKISTRGTKELVQKGLNLGLILKEVCAIVQGAGGGHKIAAGATIPKNKLNEFLVEFEKALNQQLKN